MITINIDEGVIATLKSAGLNSENFGSALVALYAIKDNDASLLNALDDYSKERRALILYKNLYRLSLIEETQGEQTHYKISEIGKDLLDEVTPFLKGEEGGVSEWIEEWINLFPKGVKSGGKILRSDPKSCLKKMNTFVKNYPDYDKDLIFRATKHYLSRKEEEDWAFTRCAIYFIDKKGEGSDLAAECEEIKEDKVKEKEMIDRSSNML